MQEIEAQSQKVGRRCRDQRYCKTWREGGARARGTTRQRGQCRMEEIEAQSQKEGRRFRDQKYSKTCRGMCRGLEAQNDKEGKGCRRQKLRVRSTKLKKEAGQKQRMSKWKLAGTKDDKEEAGQKHRMTRRKLARNTKCHEGSWLETQDYNEEAGYKHRMTRRKLARNKE